MLTDYKDITSRIAEKPKWYDSNGVPRYDPFRPNDVPNIYAKEAVLYRIDCQACGQQFKVALHWHPLDDILLANIETHPLSWWAAKGHLSFGDPPHHGGCAGETMMSESRRILEFWKRDGDWVRVPELESIVLDEED